MDARPSSASAPVTYDEDMRPGCYEQAGRLAVMDVNHVEASMCFPTFPRFCGQTFLEREDKELALACVAGLQRLDDRRVVRRRRRRPADPADAHPAVGRRAGGRRGPALRGQGRRRRRLQRVPPPARPAQHPLALLGSVLRRRARRPTPSSTCTSARRRTVARTAPDSPHLVSTTLFFEDSHARRHRLDHLRRAGPLPRHSASRSARPRSGGCRSCSSAWTRHGVAGATHTTAASCTDRRAPTARAGLRLHLSTTCTACHAVTSSAWTTSCSRSTTPTPTRLGRTPSRPQRG